MNTISKTERRRLAGHVAGLAFDGARASSKPPRDKIADAFDPGLDDVTDTTRALLNAAAGLAVDDLTPTMQRAVLGVLAVPVIEKAHSATPYADRRDDISRPPLNVLKAAARIAADPTNSTTTDSSTLDRWVGTKGNTVVANMDDYVVEDRGLPAGFDEAAQKAFVAAVEAELRRLGGNVKPPFIGVVAGRLILDGNTVPGRADFKWAVKRGYDDGVEETDGVANKIHYDGIVDDLKDLRPRQPIRVQELASVADYVIAAGDDWSIDDARDRKTQVTVGLLKYADGTSATGFAPLELPAIISADASNQEIEPQNVKAVGMIAASCEIEQTGAFDAVDRMVELFMEGMLPVRDDSGGRALDNYYWRAEDRLDAGDRAAQYARALGVGHSARSDVQPNMAFQQHVMRFVSSLVRYDGDLQVSNVVTASRGERPSTSEKVRKAAQDLAANASLYGWGFSIFAARRLSKHIDLVFDVLGQETLQRAYGVTGPWQLVERVSAVEFGTTPAVVQHRTRAKAIKDILDLLAAYSSDLSVSGAVKRFLPGVNDLINGQSTAVVSLEDYEAMVAAANSMLAVGGISDEDIASYARPTAGVPRASIPTVGGDNGTSQAGIDQLTQLVAQGQTPTLDQLKKLLPIGMG
jgi:hypothetical protein